MLSYIAPKVKGQYPSSYPLKVLDSHKRIHLILLCINAIYNAKSQHIRVCSY